MNKQHSVEPEIKEEPVKRERRRKRNFELEGPLSGLPKLDPAYRYYWAVDNDPSRPGRVHSLTRMDDYDIVTHEELGIEGKGPVTRLADKAGTMNHYLIKKPIEYHKADMEERVKNNLKGIQDIADKPSGETNKDLGEFSSLSVNKK